MVINSRSSSSNRGKSFSFVPRKALGEIDCFLLGEVCSILLAVRASIGLMDTFSLFLLMAGSLASFVFGSGDGND